MGKNVDLKRASIGQAIMQAARPRVLLTPLQRLDWMYNLITTLPHDCSLTRSIVLGSAVLTRKFKRLEKRAYLIILLNLFNTWQTMLIII